MKKLLFAICTVLLAASTGQADTVLNLPAAGDHTDGDTFSTPGSAAGATFDIVYALTAFSNDESTGSDALIHGGGVGGAPVFGVHADADTTNGQEHSIEGENGERISITGLSIQNFVPGTSGLTQSDFGIEFDTITFANATAGADGVAVSFTDFGDTVVNVDSPPSIVLSTLTNFDATSSSLYLQPDSTGGSNRWSISGISVNVTTTAVPEPTTFSLLGFGAIAFFAQRRKRN